ncbi:MAG: hypothetical protein PHS49_00300 [Candidatus Gracilibacteria bacterium]|nr:hypothetical protein [Candidatus Gracilibacteria bacterium]
MIENSIENIDIKDTQKVLNSIEKVEQDVNDAINQLVGNEYDFINSNIGREVFLTSLYYMIYWYHRAIRNKNLQTKIYNGLIEYFSNNQDKKDLIDRLIHNEKLKEASRNYVLNYLTSKPTVDLVISKTDENGVKHILCNERKYFPEGNALPGGIIRDDDEDNELGLETHIFAALRIAGEKIIQDKDLIYGKAQGENDKFYYFVANKDKSTKIKLYAEDSSGYIYKDKLNQITKPSDPRHLVDTIGYSMELEGNIPDNGNIWIKKSEIMDLENENGGLTFSHHRNIVAFLSGKTSIEKERNFSHKTWIRNIIDNPLEYQKSLKQRFKENNNDLNTSFPEFFPILERMKDKLKSEEINELCSKNNILFGLREKVYNSLEHVSFKNRNFCPYLPTVKAILKYISFVDLIAREKIGYYAVANTEGKMNKEMIKYASFHMKKYEYHLNDFLNKIPDEIAIPTYEHLGATDLMKVRCSSIRFIGLSDEFIYVDEFDQSPEEFFMHDIDHSYRMSEADEKYAKITGIDKEDIMEESALFSSEYLERIKIKKSDSIEEKEMKKLKKIILFEITHEDGKPFLKDVISQGIQDLEGQTVHYEIPFTDALGHTDIIDTTNTGFSPLAYVRHKLQHGFFDRVDKQTSQIVAPEYRTAEYIAKAAYEILVDIGAKSSENARLDNDGNVSYEWLLERTCSVSPTKIHNKDFIDPAIEKYGDGNQETGNLRYENL